MTWEINLTIKDRKDKSSSVTILIESYNDVLDSDNDFASVEAVANDIVPVIDDLINGTISRVSIGKAIALPAGLKSAPSIVADVEEKGVFVFRTAYSKPKVTLPTFKDSLVVDFTQDIDTSNADVATFIFMMTDGSGSALEFVRPCDNRDAVIVGFLEAYEQFKASGK